MMHPVDRYKAIVAAADAAMIAKYGTKDFKLGTPEHEYWLRQIDIATFRSYMEEDDIKGYALRGVRTLWGKS